MFSKILVANRGEIAVRIIRACKEMGIASVAVYSQADADSLAVSLADESICIGPAPAKDSYLNQEAVITAALVTGAQAIHPGYGLLSENAAFVALCEENQIAFIGPKAEVIAAMGDKDTARRTVRSAGVPTVPGCDLVKDLEDAQTQAAQIGYPLLIKATAGGGGKGIRLVRTQEEFASAFHAASSEAMAAFGDGGVYLEKFISPAKHIEVQLLCDNEGNVVCLGERECSIQRKNQKLVEESPSPVISSQTREALMETAAKAARAAHYTGAGTIEFLYDRDGNFYFMEMNTRLQVEHPVTEFVTGIDLVKWQIRIAAGVPLNFTQQDVRISGSAIECRICAEDPEHDYRPSCGTISLLHVPGGPWVRFDTALFEDYVIPPFYDSMIGKLIVHAATRPEAIRKMKAALCELVIEGVAHNQDLQLDIMSDEAFTSGEYTTDFMEKRGR